MQSFWSGKRVTVTGGAGFLGNHIVRRKIGQGLRMPRRQSPQ